VLSTFASLGGELQKAVIEDGNYQLTRPEPQGDASTTVVA